MRSTLARLANAGRQSAKEALKLRAAASPYPVVATCPSPTCECAEMPPDLDIERELPLNGTMAAHAEQLLVLSGQSDWASKIEDERSTAPWGGFVDDVKRLLGRDGEFHDPYHNVAINTCSFDIPQEAKAKQTVQALLFPSFKMVDQISTEQTSVTDFVKTFLLPTKLHTQHDSLSEQEKQKKVRDADSANSSEWAGKVRPISAPTIMVCSHHSRDSRCGVLGPLLHAEFVQYINRRHTLRNPVLPHGTARDGGVAADVYAKSFASHPEFRADVVDQAKNGMHPINVGMVSHIGGHRWAGNVIVYIPPDYHCNPVQRVARGAKPRDTIPNPGQGAVSEDARQDEIIDHEMSPLAGKTVWYARVEPKHIEGIVEQTIGHGTIIGELFRGGVNADGSFLRI